MAKAKEQYAVQYAMRGETNWKQKAGTHHSPQPNARTTESTASAAVGGRVCACEADAMSSAEDVRC